MGIPKLTKFVKSGDNFSLTSIRHSSSKTVVIDGYSLCYRLHHGIGSDYFQFYDRVVEYFRNLESRGIQAFVVVDGIDFENQKLKTDRERCWQRILRLTSVHSQVENLSPYEMVLPLMAKVVFVDAIRDTKGCTKLLVADGEGERDAVALANYLSCPVVGFDSDFFIFNIEGGYIPIADRENTLVDLGGYVECFRYQQF